MAKTFTNASDNSMYKRVYKNNMDDNNSFIGMINGISLILSTSKGAYMSYQKALRTSPQYKQCQIEELPWKTTLGYVSMAVPKGSIYAEFMKHTVIEMILSGDIHEINERWSNNKPKCTNVKKQVPSISPQKTVTIFFGVALFAGISIMILVFEIMWSRIQEIFSKERHTTLSFYNEDVANRKLLSSVQRIHNLYDTFPEFKIGDMLEELGFELLMEDESKDIIMHLHDRQTSTV